MSVNDDRTQDLLDWAEWFSRMKLDPEDVRFPIQLHVRKIDALMQLDVSGLSEEDRRRVKADAAEMVRQLDYLRIAAVALAASAKLEQEREGKKKGGKATSDARKDQAAITAATVEREAHRLRAAGTPEHKLISAIMAATRYSRTTVQRYLPQK